MKTLRDSITKLDGTPLTIQQLFHFKFPILVSHELYSEIKRYKHIDDLFLNNKGIIILVDNPNGTIGHFVCIYKKNNTIHFFDPYGYPLSKILNIMNIKDNSLLNLINKSNYNLKYNKFQYESEKDKIESCGLHCICRLMLYKFNDNEYNNYLKFKDLTHCEIVGLLCFFNIL